jgi:aquacobalamin reductase/NAD(P)H-flavin reductase
MSQPKKYKAEVISVSNPVDNVYTIEFRSLSGRFRYLPGQFLHLALDEYDPSFAWPESRCFSMQSSPVSEYIKITFSIKGNFTARMAEKLINGTIVDLKLPYGELFQQEHSKDDVVFIAGGTGITPFLSILNDPSFADYKSPQLYLGVREEIYNIYTPELVRAKEINPGFRVEVVYQDRDGFLNIDHMFNHKGLLATYFISGPQNMISTFKSQLVSLGLDSGRIKSDEWE